MKYRLSTVMMNPALSTALPATSVMSCSLMPRPAPPLRCERLQWRRRSVTVVEALFICYAYCTISYLLVTSGWIIYIPYIYKTAQPINFLIPPFAYLYVRSVLNNEKTFRKIDLIHFLPFVLILINYLPFYLMNYAEKSKLVNLVINNVELNLIQQDGILSEKIQFSRN